ncbi:MAG: hypothetical protein ABSA82_03270 [Thermacetogeniaceae bacterium]|jgi:hypothetical protein
MLDSRILPAMGHLKIDKIKPTHLLDFYANLQEEGSGLIKSLANYPSGQFSTITGCYRPFLMMPLNGRSSTPALHQGSRLPRLKRHRPLAAMRNRSLLSWMQ